jgi:DNA helicase IV
VQAAPPLAAEAAAVAQQTEPEPARGGSTKKDKERQRKERQRQRKVEEAWEALRRAFELLEETTGARGVDAVEEAMQAAAKHVARSERLAALMAVARDLVEQARAAEAERGRVAAEEAAAAAAVEAAERLRLEEDPDSTHAERAE